MFGTLFRVPSTPDGEFYHTCWPNIVAREVGNYHGMQEVYAKFIKRNYPHHQAQLTNRTYVYPGGIPMPYMGEHKSGVCHKNHGEI